MIKLQYTLLLFFVSLLCFVQLHAQDFTPNSFIEQGIQTLATADFNNDELIDLVGLKDGSIDILINKSSTVIEFETNTILFSPLINGSLAAIDVDGDDDIDIAYASESSMDITILINQGDNENFTLSSTGFSGINELSFFDLDSDGDPDLIGYAKNNNIVSTFINDGNGTFSVGSSIAHANEISFVDYGDIDDDGDIDFALSVDKFSGETIAIYINDGLSNFTKLSSFDVNALNNAVQVKIIDINKDGKMDVLGLNDKKLTAFVQNDILGFIDQDIISPSNEGDLSSFEVADFDGDDILDIVIGDLTKDLHWYRNESLIFVQKEISDINPINNLLSADFDNDGDIDFIAANGDFQAYRNDIPQLPSSVFDIYQSTIEIFPNPTNSYFNVSTDSENEQFLEVINVTGESVFSNSFRISTRINLEHIPTGVYFIRIYENHHNAIIIKKLSKI